MRWIRISSVLFLAVIGLAFARPVARAQQNGQAIQYGDTVKGSITNSATGYAQVYAFSATAGDTITIVMTRTSGNLRPLIAVVDPSQPSSSANFLLTEGKTSADGTSATVDSYTIATTGVYAIFATRENLDKGTTSGSFTLSLQNGSGGGNSSGGSGGSGSGNGGSGNGGSGYGGGSNGGGSNGGLGGGINVGSGSATPAATSDNSGGGDNGGGSTSATPTSTPSAGGGNNGGSGGSSSTSVQTFTVGTAPTYSIWGGSNLFVANYGDGTVSVLNADGSSAATIQTGGSPFSLGWDGTNIWVADIGTNAKPGTTVSVFDPTGQKVGTYKVGKQPFSLSYDSDDSLMWIALYGDDKVVAVDAKGKISKTINTASKGHNPNTVLWTSAGLWVTLTGTQQAPGNTVVLITASGQITGAFKVGKSPADLAWDDTDQTLFVANYDDGAVSALSAAGKTLGTYKVGKNAAALAWDGTNLWVSLSGENAVAAMSPQGKVLTKVPLDVAPNGITFDGQASVWVSLQGTTQQPGSQVAQIPISLAAGQ